MDFRRRHDWSDECEKGGGEGRGVRKRSARRELQEADTVLLREREEDGEEETKLDNCLSVNSRGGE